MLQRLRGRSWTHSRHSSCKNKKKQKRVARSSGPAPEDEVIEQLQPKRQKENQFDFFLRKFEYRKAVEVMLDTSTPISWGLALLDELLQRGVLRVALSDM